MARPLWFVALLKKTFSQRFLFARLTKVPIFGAMMDRLLFEGDDIVLLPRDAVIEVGEQVEPPGSVVLPSSVVDHFIDKARFHWIMNACICREASDCRKHPHDLGCLFLGEATRKIHPKLGRPATKEEAKEHLRRCREAGLVHLVGRNKIDTVWLGVGPGERLLTICNCCSCCCLWRMLPYLTDRIGCKVGKMPGVTVTVTDRCTGCGACLDDVCFAKAIEMVDGRARHTDACRGCGRCASLCPEGAIEVSYEGDRSPRVTIERLSRLVDLT
ncbi:MAG: 4Fe-4S binding protein [Deltaproteobacteria bacterium]|nr:4Fe-4S binding protein [Deltaproteobacteria bacterium]